MTIYIATQDAKEKFSELVNQVENSKEPIIFQRRGKDVAGLVSIEDLKFLESVKDRNDLDEAVLAYKEAKDSGAISLEALKQQLGIA